MPGEPDPQYVLARRALLEALEALEAHRDALVLVGAQAVYLHTGNAALAVPEYTTDADFAIGPDDLASEPLLADALTARGFTERAQPGGWLSPDGIYVDLMVPDSLAGPGRRGARLGAHGKRVARRAKGLEGALVDRDRRVIGALDPRDEREIEIWVAGPGALFVAKAQKLAERVGAADRVVDKDALDLVRLLRSAATSDLADRLALLHRSEIAADTTREATSAVAVLFESRASEGAQMVARAVAGIEDPEELAESSVVLVRQLVELMDRSR